MTLKNIKKTVSFLILSILVFTNATGQSDFVVGELIDSVSVTNSKNESFALYLPKSYKKDVLSPIVFVFDPAARGRAGVSPFIEAVETHGYIIVCSNNSRNGAYSKSFDIANRLFDHVFKNFNIKQNDMYLAGFSGGSRLVSAIAVLTNSFSGVIACGAGFSKDPTHTPSFQKFTYVGICGDEDMNYSEMRNNKGFLEKVNFKNTLFTFHGGHRWPPKEEINRVFRWIAVQKGTNNNISSEYLNLALKEVDDYKKNDDIMFAAEHYERIVGSYPTSPDTDKIKAGYDLLINSKEYKVANKNMTTALSQEGKIAKTLYTRIAKDLENPDKANMGWWEKEFKKLVGT